MDDVDAFAVRVGLNAAAPAAVLRRPIKLTGPLSDVLRQYFRVTTSALGVARSQRIRDFVAAYGGVVVGTTITNRDAFVARLRPSVAKFATMYAFGRVTHNFPKPPPNRPPIDSLIEPAVDDAVSRFVDWLAARL